MEMNENCTSVTKWPAPLSYLAIISRLNVLATQPTMICAIAEAAVQFNAEERACARAPDVTSAGGE
jgi:hypothetical protein